MSNRIKLSVWREVVTILLTSFIWRRGHLRDSRSERVSQALCQAPRGGAGGELSGPHSTLQGLLTLVLVSLPCLGLWIDHAVGDGPMDHLSISLAPFSSIKSSSRVWEGREGRERGKGRGGKRPLKGPHSPSLFTAPRGDREGGGGQRDGWECL